MAGIVVELAQNTCPKAVPASREAEGLALKIAIPESKPEAPKPKMSKPYIG